MVCKPMARFMVRSSSTRKNVKRRFVGTSDSEIKFLFDIICSLKTGNCVKANEVLIAVVVI